MMTMMLKLGLTMMTMILIVGNDDDDEVFPEFFSIWDDSRDESKLEKIRTLLVKKKIWKKNFIGYNNFSKLINKRRKSQIFITG